MSFKPVTKETCEICAQPFEVEMASTATDRWGRVTSSLWFKYGTEQPAEYPTVCVDCGRKIYEAMIGCVTQIIANHA